MGPNIPSTTAQTQFITSLTLNMKNIITQTCVQLCALWGKSSESFVMCCKLQCAQMQRDGNGGSFVLDTRSRTGPH